MSPHKRSSLKKPHILRYSILVVLLALFAAGVYVGLRVLKSYTAWHRDREEMVRRFALIHRAIENKKGYYRIDFGKPRSDKPNLEDEPPTRIFDRRGRLIGEFFASNMVKLIQPNEVPETLTDLIIAMEDRRFREHHGIDPWGIARAAVLNLVRGRIVAGGSTITQQLVKVVCNRRERTIDRKLYEMFGAFDIERLYEKDEIMLMYLNRVYLGHGCYGVGSAARIYFNKEVRNLLFEETALIVSLLTAPNYYSPINSLTRSQEKVDVILDVMVERGIITAAQKTSGRKRLWRRFSEGDLKQNMSNWRMSVNKTPYVNEYIRKILLKYLSEDSVRIGHEVYTTIDLDKQRAARDVMGNALRKLNRARSSESKAKDSRNREADLPFEGALVTLRVKNGGIEAMIGGRMFTLANQLNRAVMARRQVGSLLKPFIYALAFDHLDMRPGSPIVDKRYEYRLRRGVYRPRNYDHKYLGKITIREALLKSRNTCAVKTAHELGIERFTGFLGTYFRQPDRFKPYLSAALGTLEMTPMEVARLYHYLARNGTYRQPFCITKIRKIDGKRRPLVASYPELTEGKTPDIGPVPDGLISRPAALQIHTVLEDIWDKGATAHKAKRRTGFEQRACGKTGTTSDYHDAWFAGYDPEYVTVVWLGRDKNVPGRSIRLSGGGHAAPIWCRYTSRAMWNQKTVWFPETTPARTSPNDKKTTATE